MTARANNYVLTAQSLLAGFTSPSIAVVRPRLTIAHIQAVVANHFGIAQSDMVCARRSRDVAHPRQIAMYLARHLTPKSLPDIGARFGGRDHTTVMHAIKAVERRMESDAEVAADVAALRQRIAA